MSAPPPHAPCRPAARRARPGSSCSASIIPIRRPPTRRRSTICKTARPDLSWCLPARSAPMALASTGRPRALARVLDGVELDAGIAIDLNLSRRRATPRVNSQRWSSARYRAGRGRSARRPQSARRLCLKRPQPARLDRTRAIFRRPGRRAWQATDFAGRFAVADGRIIHNAGGSEAQELAFVLAGAVAYLRALEASGMTLEAARDAIYFRLRPTPTSSSPWRNSAPRENSGRGSSGLRACAKPDRDRRRDRVAHDDQARSLT
jgi:hypothetical protein